MQYTPLIKGARAALNFLEKKGGGDIFTLYFLWFRIKYILYFYYVLKLSLRTWRRKRIYICIHFCICLMLSKTNAEMKHFMFARRRSTKLSLDETLARLACPQTCHRTARAAPDLHARAVARAVLHATSAASNQCWRSRFFSTAPQKATKKMLSSVEKAASTEQQHEWKSPWNGIFLRIVAKKNEVNLGNAIFWRRSSR